ncbi:MAG: ribonuclease Y [Chloroflexi bacterium]|nr:ribonuclease Y [Chloroflexota bacterium]
MDTPFIIALLVVTLVAAGVAGGIVYWAMGRRLSAHTVEQGAAAEAQLEAARSREKEIVLEARDEALRIRREAEAELRDGRGEITRLERRLEQKEENLDKKTEALERRDRQLQRRESENDQVRQEIEQLKVEQARELERVAALTGDEAKALLLARVETEMRDIASRRVREIEQEAREEGDRRAREVLAIAVQRCAPDYVAESLQSVVPLPSDDMKGRIIGREGRNIRALEQATGCDLIVDDTPEAVTLSGFDPVRREIARRSLAKLIQDGRIHPARIEEVVAKAKQEVDQVIREEGERAVYETNVQGLHADLIKLLGRLKYRTSYGQNMLQHSIECSFIAGSIASEIGADVRIAKAGALLHDIGKAADHEIEGPHAEIGADIARRLGCSSKVVHCIAAHHYEVEPESVEAFIVAVADAISGGRPGARRESVESYIKRLEALEGVANSFDGVERCFAIQAGREVRIMVKPADVDDLGAARLARDVVKKIEESLEYPGQIKVTVIRETRAVDYAR